METKTEGETTRCMKGCVPAGRRITRRQIQDIRNYVAGAHSTRRKWSER